MFPSIVRVFLPAQGRSWRTIVRMKSPVRNRDRGTVLPPVSVLTIAGIHSLLHVQATGKKSLSFEAEMSDDEAVLCIDFAGRTIAVHLFLRRGR